eukprot:c11871_g1_i2.p1 GENE.c11871_g1_i2~~c11871_g1_i2.p1  ORF type:complete len:741 (+),score=139.31 c11871_g1_i2:266-2488(+)
MSGDEDAAALLATQRQSSIPAAAPNPLGFDFPGRGKTILFNASEGPGTAHVVDSGAGSLTPGTADVSADVELGIQASPPHAEPHAAHAAHPLLGQWSATAICANDITSSCLYTAGIASATAGRFAPIALAMIAIVLYGFRGVYAEVGAALPLNGGSYTLLLNTTAKSIAALASCLSCLSYIATAVVSATSAMAYLEYLLPFLEVWYMSISVIIIFAVITVCGVSDSARVAIVIFLVHVSTLFALLLASSIQAFRTPGVLGANWAADKAKHHGGSHIDASRLFAGFCVSALGITGFETSANFIEQQEPGVFPKTLRNMWAAVSLFNPSLALLAWATLPYSVLIDPANQANLLVHLAHRSAMPELRWLVGIDAVLVLCGAVLTAYIGAIGLVRRMALDRCLPSFLLRENKWRNTPHWIIILFCGVCVGLYVASRFNIRTLAGVYAVSFLGVMVLFSIGNLILKWKRSELKVPHRASSLQTICCGIAVLLALLGNISYDRSIVFSFAFYFFGLAFIVSIMFIRIRALRFLRSFVKETFPARVAARFVPWIESQIFSLRHHPVLFFAKRDILVVLNKALLYARSNETTNWFIICHVYPNIDQLPVGFVEAIGVLGRLYPKIRCDLVLVQAPAFNPEVIDIISKRLHIEKNFMFIGCPSESFTYNLSQLGGLRICTAGALPEQLDPLAPAPANHPITDMMATSSGAPTSRELVAAANQTASPPPEPAVEPAEAAGDATGDAPDAK